MFIVSGALERTGAIDIITAGLRKLVKLPYRGFILIMVIGVAGSRHSSTTPGRDRPHARHALTLTRDGRCCLEAPHSTFLCLHFRGTCTLLGTSTNLLASGILRDAGHAPIGMFELAFRSLPAARSTSSSSVKLLPHRETLTSILSDEERKEFMTEAFVRSGWTSMAKPSPRVLLQGRGIRLLEIVRHGIAVSWGRERTSPPTRGPPRARLPSFRRR